LLTQYADFFEEPTSLPPQRLHNHTIPLKGGSEPHMIHSYRVPHKQKDQMKDQIKLLLESSLIRCNNSPYASTTILVKKGWNMEAVDRLSTSKYYDCQGQIEDLLDELNGAQLFSTLDLRLGYHQIR
jgi:hypothetical protein